MLPACFYTGHFRCFGRPLALAFARLRSQIDGFWGDDLPDELQDGPSGRVKAPTYRQKRVFCRIIQIDPTFVLQGGLSDIWSRFSLMALVYDRREMDAIPAEGIFQARPGLWI